MIINELLLEKYRTQEALDKLAEHDPNKYVANSHSRVEMLVARLELKLKYGKPGEVLSEYTPLGVSQ